MRRRRLETVYHLALSLAIAGAGLGCSGGSDGSTGGASSGGASGVAGATSIGGSALGGSGGASSSGGESVTGGESGSGNAAGATQGGTGGAVGVGGATGGASGDGGTSPSRPLGSWVEIDATLFGTTPVKLEDGSVLLIGGFSSAAVFRFQPDDNSITRMNDLPEPRGNFAAARLENGQVLIAGGDSYNERDGMATSLLYNAELDEWTPTGELPEARYEVQGVRLPDGDVLVVGGAAAGVGGVPSSDVYRYSVAQGEWETLGPLDEAARYHRLFLFGDDTLFVASPYPQLYQISSQSVVLSADFAVYREFFVAAQLPDETVVVMGGKPLSSREEPLDVVNQFIPGATAWEDLAPLPTPKYNHAGLTLSDGTILVAGGVSTFVEDAEDPSPLAAARYVPSLNAWFPEAQPPVPVGGTNANALLLDDGSALIVISETLRFYPEPWQ